MITPLMIGKGGAGKEIAKSLIGLASLEPELKIAQPVWIPRNTHLKSIAGKYDNPIFIIANPPGLHTKTIVEATEAGFDAIICEKPVCVSLEEISILEKIPADIGIFHAFRQMWGPQTLKQICERGDFGELVCIEGRYWRSAVAADRLLKSKNPESSWPKTTWKDDPALSGMSDTLLDLGSHWADLVSYLYAEPPQHFDIWKSYRNAEQPHRDTHVQMTLDFPSGGRAMGSISKIAHGTGNDLELNLIGTKASASWHFENPNQLIIGRGRDREVLTRSQTQRGSKPLTSEILGGNEDYTEICREYILQRLGIKTGNYPRLSETLPVLAGLIGKN